MRIRGIRFARQMPNMRPVSLIPYVLLTITHFAFATETVKLRVIHADPMTTQLAIRVDGEPASKPLNRRQSDLLEVPVASHNLEVLNAETSEPLAGQQQFSAEPGHCYTLIVARESTGPHSLLNPVLVPMECKPPESGKANATFVLASPSVDKVDVYAGWFKIISNLKKGTYEGPKTIPAGDYKVVAKEDGKPVLGPIELSPKAGHSYTIVAFDNPSAAEGEQLVHRVYEDDFTSSSSQSRN